VQIYGFINNLFNRKFATFGTFFNPQSTVAIAIPNVLFDHRTVTPAQPLSVYVGMRAKL
jgi:iron complex outermembrane receptor protein